MYSSPSASTKKRRRWLRFILVAFVAFVVIGLGVTVYVRQWYQNNLKPLSSSTESIVVTIPTGSSVNEIGDILHEKKVIRSASAFERYVSSTEQADLIKAGTYRLSPSMSVSEITTHLTEGKVATDLVTILPGRRLEQIRKDLVDAGFPAAEVDAALDPKKYKDHPALTDKPSGASLEGYLYPESFQEADGTKVVDIITQSLDEMHKRLTPDVRAGITEQGFTLHEGITLASVIEREVSKPDDRKTVAQVFMTRLKVDMPLGADATFFYAAATTKKRPTPDLDNPYNTRLYKGLPPGPISNVTETSLAAVAAPASSDYLYFVSGDDGKTYFSRTEEDHLRLTAQHCIELCKLPDTAE